MGKFEQFMSWLREDDSGEGQTPPAAGFAAANPPAAQPVTPPAANPPAAAQTGAADDAAEALARMRRDLERSAQENRRLKAAFTMQAAAEFADSVIRDGRAFPAEKEPICAAYVQASLDDDAIGPVTFSDGNPGSRIELLKRAYAARKPHQLDAEQLPSDLVAIFNKLKTDSPADANGEPTPERRAQLLQMSTLGQAALNDKKN